MSGTLVAGLKKLIAANGVPLTVVQLNPHHWQITGGVHVVNWYPESKSGAMYLNGATKGLPQAKPLDVMNAAMGTTGKPVAPVNVKKRPDLQRARRAMYREDPHCHWCKCRVWEKEVCDPQIVATVDHRIPRSKGGSDRRDNLVLACHGCNKKRKNELGAPK